MKIHMKDDEARRLVDTYADMIFRISVSYLKNPYDAEDICQSVFCKYLYGHPVFENAAHEKAWIIRTTVNACKDLLKSAFRKRTLPLDEAKEMFVSAPPEEDTLLKHMRHLTKNQRLSLYLHYYEGYQAKEIASILQKSENTVSSYLSRGRKKLKELLEAEERMAEGCKARIAKEGAI